MSAMHELFGEVIHAYTRAQALDDGALVDVTDTARKAGFTVPVALTAAAWAGAVAWDHGPDQDEAGRLWDVLYMAALTARHNHGGRRRIEFQLVRVPNVAGMTTPHLVTLHLHIGPGDNAEPVITVMTADED